MNRISSLFKKDIILGIKDVFVILELVSAVFIVLLLLFVIPADLKREATIFVYDSTGVVEDFLKTNMPNYENSEGECYVESREEVIKGMQENRSALGLIITEKVNTRYQVEFLRQPYTSDHIAKEVNVEMDDFLSILAPPAGVYPSDVYETVRVTSLQWGLRDVLPFNKQLMPPILLMMAGIVGLFAMVSLISQERTDLTIRAYRVSPAGLWEFIVSKHLVVLFTGLCSFSILYLPMMGFNGYLESLLIIVLTIIMGSSLGVILGSFFKNPMGAMLWVLVLVMFLALPVISLFLPVFSPEWLKLIPSYHTLFALDAAMFPNNNSHIIWQGAAVLAVLNMFLFPLSTMIFSKIIQKKT